MVQSGRGRYLRVLWAMFGVAKARSMTDSLPALRYVGTPSSFRSWRARRSVSVSRCSALGSLATALPAHSGWCALKSPKSRVSSPSAASSDVLIAFHSWSLGPVWPWVSYTLIRLRGPRSVWIRSRSTLSLASSDCHAVKGSLS